MKNSKSSPEDIVELFLNNAVESLFDGGGNGIATNMEEIAHAIRGLSTTFWPGGSAQDPGTGIGVGSVGEAISCVSQAICNVAEAINNLADAVSKQNK